MNRGWKAEEDVDVAKLVQPGKNAAVMRIDVEANNKLESAQRTIFMLTTLRFLECIQRQALWNFSMDLQIRDQIKQSHGNDADDDASSLLHTSVLFVSWKDRIRSKPRHGQRQPGLDSHFSRKFIENLKILKNI
jgi:hypothetical protein